MKAATDGLSGAPGRRLCDRWYQPMTSTPLPESTRNDLNHGIYSLAELRGFLAFSGQRRDGAMALPWLTRVLNPVDHQPRVADYSFSDLISLFVVRVLLEKGVRQKAIRDAEQYLREQWDTDR